MKNLSPTERSQTAKRMREAVKEKVGRKPGVPNGWTPEAYGLEVENARKEAREVFNYMADQGMIPEDEMAQAALLESLTIMKNRAATAKDKLAAARIILDFTKSKPVSKQDVTLHNAEAFLDKLAEAEENES